MINTLFSSQSGGTKYTIGGEKFGWKAIIDMYVRECQRTENGEARMIPKLREAFVLHDSWMKLDVLPAKIVQVSAQLVFVHPMLRICFFVARNSSFRTI